MLDWIKGIFSGVATIGREANKTISGVGARLAFDKDLLVELATKGEERALAAYLAAVQVKTIPWVDALHKMGRQIQVYLVIALAWYCASQGKDLPPVAWSVVGGAVGVYGIMKGKGK